MKRMFPSLKFEQENNIEDGFVIQSIPYCKKTVTRNLVWIFIGSCNMQKAAFIHALKV